MLQAMREGAGSLLVKILIFGLLGLAMLGLAVMDLGGFFRGTLGRSVLAEVGSAEVGLVNFDRTYRNQLQQSQMDAATARMINMPARVLQQEINRLILLQAAYKSDLRLSETFIANKLSEQLDAMGVPQTDREEFFKNYLRQTGMNEAMLVNSIQQDTTTTLLMDPIEQKFKAPRLVAQSIYAFENEKRVGHLVMLEKDQIENIPEFSDEEKRAYYGNHQAQFTRPETRTIAYTVITKEKAIKGESITDEQIKSYYESNIDLYTTPPSRKFAQVIVQDKEKADEVVSQALSHAKKDLKEVTASVMDDNSSYDFVPSDWFTKDSLPPELAEAVYGEDENAEPPYVTGPIETALGYHVIQVTDSKPAEKQPLSSEIKNTIKSVLKENMALDRVYEISEQFDDLVASGASIKGAAQELDLEFKVVEGLLQSGQSVKGENVLQDVPNAQEVLLNAFALNTGEVSPLLETEEGNLMAVGVVSITPSEPIPFEEVENQVVKALADNFKENEIENKSKELIQRYENSDQNLHALASVYNLPYKKTRAINRKEASAEDAEVSPQVLQKLFSLKEEGAYTSIDTDEGKTIIALGDVIPVKEIPKKSEDINVIRTGMGEVLANDIVEQFVMYWREKLGVEVNQDLLMQRYLNPEE